MSESIEALRISTPSRAFDSYDNCINACMSKSGLFMYLQDNNSKTFTFKYIYHPPRGYHDSITIREATLTGISTGNIIDLLDSIDTTILPQYDYSKVFSKASNEEFLLSISAGVYNTKLRINPYSYFETVSLDKKVNCNNCLYKYECLAVGDEEMAQGAVMSPFMPQGDDGNVIRFGEWSNPECKRTGHGWYINWGSCGVGSGQGLKGCQTINAIRRVVPD